MATENKTTTSTSQSGGNSGGSSAPAQSSTPSTPSAPSTTAPSTTATSTPATTQPSVSPATKQTEISPAENSGTLSKGPTVATPATEKGTVTPLPQVDEMQGQGPLALPEEELTPGEKVMTAAPYKDEKPVAVTPAKTPAVTPAADDLSTVTQILNKTDNRPTAAQLEEERKRNKRNALLATIGDGLSAFHKAYSYARGVKPMDMENLSDKMYNRLEKVRKEREANDIAYRNAMLRAHQIEQNAANNKELMKHREEQAAETKRHNEAMENYYLNKAEKDREAKAAEAKAKREAEDKRNKENNQVKKNIADANRAAQNQRSANANETRKIVSANKTGGKGAQEKTETTTTYSRNGNVKKKVVKETKSGTTNKKGSLLPNK